MFVEIILNAAHQRWRKHAHDIVDQNADRVGALGTQATRQRILDSARSLGYRPNLSARGLRTERTNTIGILVDDIMSVFTPPLVRGIQDYFNEHAISCLVMNSDWRPDIEHMAIESLLSRSVDGIIFAEYSHLVVHDALSRSQIPHLFVHRLFAKSVQNSILPDDYYGATLAVRHLLDLGHRRIAYILSLIHI